jgi:hypothetical protein
MTTKTPTAGDRLRADLDEALRLASDEAGRALEFDEAERHLVDQAAASADRAQEMSALYRAELTRKPEPRPTALGKLAAEIRLCEKQAVEFVARVKVSLGPEHRVQWHCQHLVSAVSTSGVDLAPAILASACSTAASMRSLRSGIPAPPRPR